LGFPLPFPLRFDWEARESSSAGADDDFALSLPESFSESGKTEPPAPKGVFDKTCGSISCMVEKMDI
jgi:hypothetical protein